jgi:CxxC-x17-CxxC domain-containing protein
LPVISFLIGESCYIAAIGVEESLYGFTETEGIPIISFRFQVGRWRQRRAEFAVADQRLFCRDCGTEFFFTAGEQRFYQERGLSLPSRCSDCRSERRAQRQTEVGQSTADWRLALDVTITDDRPHHGRDDTWGGNRSYRFYTAFCDECGRETEIPFRPRGDRPVYCRDCFNARRGR